MTDRLILTILIALACPLLLPVVVEEEEMNRREKKGDECQELTNK